MQSPTAHLRAGIKQKQIHNPTQKDIPDRPSMNRHETIKCRESIVVFDSLTNDKKYDENKRDYTHNKEIETKLPKPC